MPLLPQGYLARRAREYLDVVRSKYEELTELTINWEADEVLRNLTTILADLLDDLDQVVQALADARDINNAIRLALDILGALLGAPRESEKASTVLLTITGDNGTFIPKDTLIQGGGLEDLAQWRTDEAVTITTGSVVVPATATEAGVISAAPGEIDAMVDVISGVISVTNLASAVVGSEEEGDVAYRLRLASLFERRGEDSLAATRAEVLKLDAVTAAVVVANDTSSPAITGGLNLPERSIAVVVWPNTLTTEEQQDVVRAIYASVNPVATLFGSITGQVTGEDNYTKDVHFSFASVLPVNIDISLTIDSTFVEADVEAEVQGALEAYLDGLDVGQAARMIDVYCAAKVAGVQGASFTLNGGSTDIEPQITQIIRAGVVTIL